MEPIEIAEVVGLAALAVVGVIVLGIGVSHYKLPRSDDIHARHQNNEYNQTASKKAKWWIVTGVGIIVLSLFLIFVLLM